MSQEQPGATNLTVLGAASLSTTLPVVGSVLVLLFVLMKPEVTTGFSLLERLCFWTTHIGLGLLGILLASWLLRARLTYDAPPWLSVLLTGLVGAALLAPMYLVLEELLPPRLIEEPDDWLDYFALRGVFQSVVAEFLEVAPTFLTAWVAVNLPLIAGRLVHKGRPSSGPGGPGGEGDPVGGTPTPAPLPKTEETQDDFYSRLPRAIGCDIILISSDMHYLHVYTTLGKCMILGTLRDVAQELGENGMLVHRSHWVAHQHVVRLVQSGRSWKCVLSNDQRVPISRRNHGKVSEWYGRSGNVVSLADGPSKTASRRPIRQRR